MLKNPINRKPGVERSSISNLLSPRRELSFEFNPSGDTSESEEGSSILDPQEIGVIQTTSNKQRPVPALDFTKIKNKTLNIDENVYKPAALSPEERQLEEKIDLMREELYNMKFELTNETADLVKISKENSELLEENQKLAQDYILSYQKKGMIQETISKMQGRGRVKRGRLTTEINPAADENQLIFKVALEGGSSVYSDEEIEIRAELFYGNEESFQD